MAKFSLIPFDKTNSPKTEVKVELNQNHDSVFLSFRIKDGLSFIDLGSSTPNKERVIKLWEKTCFEFFLKNSADEYVEFNFSPCFEWNCFYFKKTGDPLAEWEKMNRPETQILLSIDHFFLMVELKKELFPPGFFNQNTELSVGITSVLKNKSGQLSYWALAHSDTRPNFHDFRSFIKYT
jgi:hypothetical protein